MLRWALAAEPIVELIVAALTDLGGGPVSMRVLAKHALEPDRVRAMTALFNPELVDEIADTRSKVVWSRVQPRHFRSTTFYQYKSILKHAGVIAPRRLGGASSRGYDPDAGLWELQERRV